MDRVVQQTDFDALSCKLAAISKRYLPVPGCDGVVDSTYVRLYKVYWDALKGAVSRRTQGQVQRALASSFPVMNYGTYLRTVCIDEALGKILDRFEAEQRVQVVNLGCGSDLRMIPLLKRYSNLKYLDIDFSDSVTLKSDALLNSETLQNELGISVDPDSKLAKSSNYTLVACDLRDLETLIHVLRRATDTAQPVVFITECALCYLQDDSAQKLINGLLELYTNGGYWISYDPIGGSVTESNDRFGTIMQSNLKASRSLEMPTLIKYYSKELYASRWKQIENPNLKIQIDDMWEMYNTTIDDNEKQRLKRLQFLDEIEELRVMQQHYILLKVEW